MRYLMRTLQIVDEIICRDIVLSDEDQTRPLSLRAYSTLQNHLPDRFTEKHRIPEIT